MEWSDADYMKFKELREKGVRVEFAYDIINTRGLVLLKRGCPVCSCKITKRGLVYRCDKCGFEVDLYPRSY